jgi:hypothetical protein
MHLKELRWRGIHWIYLARDMDQSRAFEDTVMSRLVPENIGNFLSS